MKRLVRHQVADGLGLSEVLEQSTEEKVVLKNGNIYRRADTTRGVMNMWPKPNCMRVGFSGWLNKKRVFIGRPTFQEADALPARSASANQQVDWRSASCGPG
jgi:hypothetical protein